MLCGKIDSDNIIENDYKNILNALKVSQYLIEFLLYNSQKFKIKAQNYREKAKKVFF